MIYKALIVDDESIIRNGILGMPVWNELNISPVGAATGTQGLHLICQEHFDLVITDIRMPEMDGLELIRKAREFDKALPFVVLSGHDSFDYAQTAMRYGVKDYLLKPIAPNELSRVIKNIIAECEEAKRKQNKEEIIKHQQEQLADTALERRMRDLLLHIDRAADFSADNFDIQQSFDVMLYLIQAEGKDESFNAVATISNLIRAIRSSTDISADDNLITFTFMDSLILLIPPNSNAAQKALLTLQSALHDNDCRISVAVAGPCAVENISQLYAKALNLIDYKFYYDEFCLLTAEETALVSPPPDYAELLRLVARNDIQEAFLCLNRFTEQLRESHCLPLTAHRLCTELYLQLAGLAGNAEREGHLLELVLKNRLLRLVDLKSMLRQLLSCIESHLCEQALVKYSNIVRSAIEYTKEHLANEELSTAHIANDILYINPDYFGKLFKKETGLSFTRYLVERRMELAKELICSNPNIKIYELSELCGFNGNAQYLSQIFRSSFGCTPTEYKKMVALK